MSANPNNSPKQKADWKANQKLGSRFIRHIRADRYADYLASDLSRYRYDSQGCRIK